MGGAFGTVDDVLLDSQVHDAGKLSVLCCAVRCGAVRCGTVRSMVEALKLSRRASRRNLRVLNN
jgi:hypothetical protein